MLQIKQTLDNEFQELCLKIGSAYGLDEVSSKIFSILYLEPDEICLEELANKLGYSLSTISKCVSQFERVPLFKKYRKPKSKKIYCFLEKDFEKLTAMMLIKLLNDKIVPFREKVPLLIDKYDNKSLDNKSKQKIQILKNALKQTKNCECAIHVMLKEFEISK
ncbi:MAG: hypothetical protein WC755_04040 [Candidatus Woesearchaeota archaeon]|jgi:DNA-binding transcriptional regulator GbsR (MarR family)